MYNEILSALRATEYPFAEVAWRNAPAGDYGTFAVDSAYDALWTDNHIRSQTLEGAVHLFTKTPGPGPVHAVQAALDTLEISWYLSSNQFEEDTGYIHWEWIVSWTEVPEYG